MPSRSSTLSLLDALPIFMRIPRFADPLFLQAAHISLVLDELTIVDERLRRVAQVPFARLVLRLDLSVHQFVAVEACQFRSVGIHGSDRFRPEMEHHLSGVRLHPCHRDRVLFPSSTRFRSSCEYHVSLIPCSFRPHIYPLYWTNSLLWMNDCDVWRRFHLPVLFFDLIFPSTSSLP